MKIPLAEIALIHSSVCLRACVCVSATEGINNQWHDDHFSVALYHTYRVDKMDGRGLSNTPRHERLPTRLR